MLRAGEGRATRQGNPERTGGQAGADGGTDRLTGYSSTISFTRICAGSRTPSFTPWRRRARLSRIEIPCTSRAPIRSSGVNALAVFSIESLSGAYAEQTASVFRIV